MAFNFTDENTKELIESGQPLVIDFWATWCGPCMRLAPVIDQLATEYEGKVLIGKYNVDEESDMSTEFGIRSIPTLLFFKEGELKGQLIGGSSKSEVEAKINELL